MIYVTTIKAIYSVEDLFIFTLVNLMNFHFSNSNCLNDLILIQNLSFLV